MKLMFAKLVFPTVPPSAELMLLNAKPVLLTSLSLVVFAVPPPVTVLPVLLPPLLSALLALPEKA